MISIPVVPRVLLVDDNRADLELFGEALRCAGVHVETCEDSKRVRDLLLRTEELPHAVVVDGMLGGLDGPGLIAVLRREEHLAGLPFIGLTGSNYARLHEAFRKAGAAIVVEKPMRLDGFDAVVIEIVALARARLRTATALSTRS